MSRAGAGRAKNPPGTTALEAGELADVPTAFVATTLNVYAVPLVRPPTVVDRADPPTDEVAPPGDAVTV
jgi:hypothetical protein